MFPSRSRVWPLVRWDGWRNTESPPEGDHRIMRLLGMSEKRSSLSSENHTGPSAQMNPVASFVRAVPAGKKLVKFGASAARQETIWGMRGLPLQDGGNPGGRGRVAAALAFHLSVDHDHADSRKIAKSDAVKQGLA